MSLRPILAISTAVTVTVVSNPAFAAESGAVGTVNSAARAFAAIMANERTQIPAKVLKESQAIAIIPGVIKAGFILGGSHGRGVLVMRNADGSWSNPVLLMLTSGSIGLQAGGQSSDVVLIFRSQSSLDAMLTDEFTLGGSVSVAAGPVGGNAVSPTDAQPTADIYAYALNKGLFAGVALEGAKVAIDRGRNQDYYGQRYITLQQILTTADLPNPPETAALHQALNQALVMAAERETVQQEIEQQQLGQPASSQPEPVQLDPSAAAQPTSPQSEVSPPPVASPTTSQLTPAQPISPQATPASSQPRAATE